MHIIYFISEANKAPISISKDMRVDSTRFADLSKTDIQKASWLSIQDGLTEEDTIHLLAAEVSEDLLNWITSHKNPDVNLVVTKIPPMDEYEHPYSSYHHIHQNHFIWQYEYLYNLIEQDPDGYYYVNFDDYLHVPTAMATMKKLIEEKVLEEIIFIPQDNPDLYNANSERVRIFTTNYGYMKEAVCSTPNMLMRGTTWQKFKPEILQASVFASDSWTWYVFKKVLAISPMPGWSTHLQNGCLAPFINWEVLAKEYLSK